MQTVLYQVLKPTAVVWSWLILLYYVLHVNRYMPRFVAYLTA
jgi:hypothetical protein